jgi:hypothetical protein
MESSKTRRDFLRTSAIVGTGLVLSSCGRGNMANTEGQKKEDVSSRPDENRVGGEVTAAEDLNA